MDFRNFDLGSKTKPAKPPRISHVTWVKAFLKKHGPDQTYKTVRALAVPMFINRKEGTLNEQAGFYQSALSWLKKHHPYKGKHGVTAVQSKPFIMAQV